MSDNFSFSTGPFDERERFGLYHDIYKFAADAVALGAPVEVDARGWLWGELVCTERRVKGLGSERAAPRVRRDQSDHFCLHLNVQGDFHGDGEGGYQAVRPGEILLLDMAKPERAVTADTHFVTLAVPRAILSCAGVATDRLHGVIIPAGHAVRLAGVLMSAIAQTSLSAADTADPPADADLISLLGGCLSEMGLARASTREKTDAEKLRAAQRFIKNQLVDETLCPERVARALNLSRATLYRLFEESEGVSKYIQTQRLARLKLSLSTPSERRSVGELAHEAGFASEHHANRSFKQEFGVPPGEFRREMRISTQSYRDHGDTFQTLVDWSNLMR